MEVLASDKTGTLTLNQLTLDKEDILAWGDSTKDDVLLMASLSAKWDHNDAIDKAVTGAMGGDIQVSETSVHSSFEESARCFLRSESSQSDKLKFAPPRIVFQREFGNPVPSSSCHSGNGEDWSTL
jgi:magnesium-transporting ATPase (P-type)